MQSVRFTSLKEATRHLFLENTFDAFSLVEASFLCAAAFTIDGHCNKEFFEQDSSNIVPEYSFVPWQALRPICFQMIKGKQPPLSFRIALFLKKEQAASLFTAPALSRNADIDGFLFVLHYRNRSLTGTTGTSFHRFSMDKESERLWDQLLVSWLEHRFSLALD